MIELDNHTDYVLEMALLERIVKEAGDVSVELLLVGEKEMRRLNGEHRGKDSPTDVLSFPLSQDGLKCEGIPLGSIVICLEVAQEAAREIGHSLDAEIAVLFLHGLLHLLGYDHETDQGEMRKKEELLAVQYGLPRALIQGKTHFFNSL